LHRDDARNQEQVLQKLQAGRNRYAVSNQWSLDWFNQRLLPAATAEVAVLQEQHVGCYVRNDPQVPVQRILRTLLRMKMSGEIDDIIRLYTGSSETTP
jgi:polar amino acid transport system substrate-binding protein